MRSKNGPISGQVVKIVHDDGHEQVDDEKRAQADKRDKVGYGDPARAVFFFVDAACTSRRIVVQRTRLVDKAERAWLTVFHR